jgi:hypothetical protein
VTDVLCHGHAARALLPNGLRLRDVVARSTKQIEGPGLGHLLNPVTIGDESRPWAWVSWFGPAWQVNWTRIWCRDYFEFEAMHQPEWLDVLHTLERHEDLLRATSLGIGPLHAYVTTAGVHAFERLAALCHHVRRRDRCQQALRARHKPCADSLDEALELMLEVETAIAAPVTLEEISARVPDLLALARHRFAFYEQQWALDFESALPMAGILERLRAKSAWTWHARDSDRFGSYTTSSPEPGLLLRLYDLDGRDSNGPTYTIEVQARAPSRRSRAQIDVLVENLLDAIDSRNIKPGRFQGR